MVMLEAGEFHVKNGFTVKRMDNGDVRLRWGQQEIVCTQNEFASVVCAASKGGENHGRFFPVLDVLKSEGPIVLGTVVMSPDPAPVPAPAPVEAAAAETTKPE